MNPVIAAGTSKKHDDIMKMITYQYTHIETNDQLSHK